MEIKLLDRSVVLAAESHRSSGNLQAAKKTVDQELYPNWNKLRSANIDRIAQCPPQLSILGELARIRVDSSLSLANRSFFAPTVVKYLENATETIFKIYRNPTLHEAFAPVREPQNFLLEMRRDEVKAIQVLAQFFTGREKRELLVAGENILDQSAASLPKGDQVRNLMLVERAISQIDRGVAFDDKAFIKSVMQLLEDTSIDPHRRQTVAAWIKARKLHIDHVGTIRSATCVYQDLATQYPQHGPIYEKTLQKMNYQPKRALLLRTLAPITLWPGSLQTIRDILLES